MICPVPLISSALLRTVYAFSYAKGFVGLALRFSTPLIPRQSGVAPEERSGKGHGFLHKYLYNSIAIAA
jgi:hypothetical protein